MEHYDELKSFAFNLKLMMKKKEVNQLELSHDMDVSMQSITQWICARSLPSLDKFLSLMDYFNASFEDFFMERKEIDVKEIFGNNLRLLMETQGVKSRDLARDKISNEQTISAWLNGHSMPRNDKINKLVDYFHVPFSFFFEDNDIEKEQEETLEKMSFLYDSLSEENKERFKRSI